MRTDHVVAIDPAPCAIYRLQVLARFHVDGRLAEPGMLLETDSLKTAEILARQGRAQPLDQATADAIELYRLLRQAIPATGS